MAIDDRTANLGLAMPNAENVLEEDVERLREFAEDVDLALHLRPLSTAVTAAIAAAVAGLATANALSLGLAGRVPATRAVTAGDGLAGGGPLSQDVSLSLSPAVLTSLGRADTAVQPGRTIFTAGALEGGGDLSGNRTITTITATQEEAEAGADDVRMMTSLRVAQQRAAALASEAEATAGTNNAKTMTPLRVAQQRAAAIASEAEAVTGTDNAKTMTPLRVAQQRAAALASQAEAAAATDNVKTMTALRVAQQRAALPSGVQVTAKTATWTLAAADQGKLISITTGGIVVPSSLPAGTTISIWNNSAGNQTITQGSGVTLYNASTGATGSRTLAGRGLAVVQVISAGVAVISGAGLT